MNLEEELGEIPRQGPEPEWLPVTRTAGCSRPGRREGGRQGGVLRRDTGKEGGKHLPNNGTGTLVRKRAPHPPESPSYHWQGREESTSRLAEGEGLKSLLALRFWFQGV